MNPDLTPITEALNRLVLALGRGTLDYINTVAVVLTLAVVIWYTVETFRLRQAAQKQIEKAGELLEEAQRQNHTSISLVKEAHRQNEIAVMPMFAIVNESIPGGIGRQLVLRSVGAGPAFNLSIDATHFGNGELLVEHGGDVKIVGEMTTLRPKFYEQQHLTLLDDSNTLYEWINTGKLPDPLDIVVRCRGVNSVDHSFTFRCMPDGGQGRLRWTPSFGQNFVRS